MSEVTYIVERISCGHCVHTIQLELRELEGVHEVTASQVTKEVKVIFDPPATEDQIENLLVEINYPPVN